MRDIAGHLARRLEDVENPLAIVVSIHLFSEYLMDRMIEVGSPMAKRILSDHRTYPFSVKLALVYHMGLLADDLFHNLRKLNGLRNEYAHEIDVDLAEGLARGFTDRESRPLFPDEDNLRETVRTYPRQAVRALSRVRRSTFGWLHDIAEEQGILN